MEEAERLCDRVAIVDQGRVIAMGTPWELIASLGADQVVELQLADGARGLEQCRGVAGVLDVRQDGPILTLRVARLHETLPALLDALRRTGVPVDELRTHAPTLEDLFVSLTGRHLRDG
jgi:ABC-2 type transport system ATP-binding protein